MAQPMTATELLSPWLDISAENSLDIVVKKLELDSRLVSSGSTFVAVKGHVVDGRDFIDSAIRQGANAVIAETEELDSHGKIEWRRNIPIIYISNLSQYLSHIASRLMPLKHNRLIAVTGTNGKTTITQLIAQWLDLSGKKCAVLGTTGNGFLEALQPAANTTGHALEIQDVLSALEQQGAKYTAMEVSSHGLVQGRVKAQQFEVGVFSNLSRDHLDYHGSMEQYALAKRSLFTEHNCARAVINIDDPIGASLAKEIKSCIPVSLSPIASGQGVYATSIKYASTGIELTFSGQFGEGCFTVPLVGEFNASNILLAFATLLSLGIEKNQLLGSAGQLQSVLGRMELFQAESKAKVIVDYAHTPDALEKALLALKRHCNGKLWVIFGCGGDRDKGKRPMMAAIGESLADEVILTDDNPRSESPIEIVKDMLAGMTLPTKATVEHDRYQALAYALRHSCADDIILLAGKGHEDYQIIDDKTLHYSDRESALQLLELTQ